MLIMAIHCYFWFDYDGKAMITWRTKLSQSSKKINDWVDKIQPDGNVNIKWKNKLDFRHTRDRLLDKSFTLSMFQNIWINNDDNNMVSRSCSWYNIRAIMYHTIWTYISRLHNDWNTNAALFISNVTLLFGVWLPTRKHISCSRVYLFPVCGGWQCPHGPCWLHPMFCQQIYALCCYYVVQCCMLYCVILCSGWTQLCNGCVLIIFG